MKAAIDSMREAENGPVDQRRLKRFEDATRSLKSIMDLIKAVEALGLGPLIGIKGNMPYRDADCKPLYIALDLGLRQRRKTYHGGTIFQCIMLPDDFFDQPSSTEEKHDSLISASGRGIKVAEGGNYSELVRRSRPPGNFGTAVVNSYTSAPLPVCAGVRFSVGKFVELIYLDAALRGRRLTRNNNELDGSSKEALRKLTGHPFNFTKSVKVIVTSVNGMDAASTPERFLVASKLWSEGISAEYLPQSSVMLSLLKHESLESNEVSKESDWSLLELQTVCSLLNIPFIVVVQQHLFKDKQSVCLRRIDASTIISQSNETIVALNDLATTILSAVSRKSSAKILQEPTEAQGLPLYTRKQQRWPVEHPLNAFTLKRINTLETTAKFPLVKHHSGSPTYKR